MRILITGVAGFIGSNLAKYLLQCGHTVVGIDNLTFGFERNMSEIKENKHFTFLFGDIANSLILKNYRADVIVHLASQKIPRYTNALRTLDENYLMLRTIVTKCIEDNSKLVFASTSDVYGKNTAIPFNENADLVLGSTTVKRWAYALSKIYGEHFIIANNQEFGLNYSIARFFGSYGINQNTSWWGGPQSVFISQALKKEALEIHGSGFQTRTFTYIQDTINGLYHLITNDNSNGEIFNIGATEENEISIIDLAKLIWRMINNNDDYKINFVPYSTFGNYEDIERRVPDIGKMKNYFNFQPNISLSEGLEKTITWQKNCL